MPQEQDNQESTSGVGGKVAVGTIIVAVLGLLTAFFNQGGLDLLKEMGKPVAKQPSPSISPSISTPSPSLASPSPSPNNLLESSPSPISPSPSPDNPSPLESSPSLTSASPSPNTPSSNSSVEANIEEFIVKLQGCKRTNETVKCEFIITNNKKEDRKLTLSSSSRIIDLQGNQYIANKVEFGGYIGNKKYVNEYTYVEQNLVQDVGLKAFVTFEEVPSQVNKLALIELSVSTNYPIEFSAKMRDIPVSN